MATGIESRLERFRSALSGVACDAYVSFSAPANEYLSGFRGSTSAIVITQAEAIFLCDFRYTEQAEEQVVGYEVREVAGSIETRAGELLKQLGVKKTAFDPGVLTVWQREVVEDAYGMPIVPQVGLIARLRMVKSPDEIAKIRAASNLAEGVLFDLLNELGEGITEREVAARFEYEFKMAGASGPSFSPIVLFGSRSSLPHGVPTGRTLQRGDIVLLDFGCVRESYCSDLTRTYVYGTIPGAWFEEIYAVTLEAQLAGLAAIRPGASCRDVDAAARDIIRAAGFADYFGHGLGHGVGLEIHESPRLNIQSDAVLEAGMIVTCEPGIYLPGKGGVRIEDLIAVTEDGCDVLTRAPKELTILNP